MVGIIALNVLAQLILITASKNEGISSGYKTMIPFSSVSVIDLQRQSLKAFKDLWATVNGPNPRVTDLNLLRGFEKISKNLSRVEASVNPSDFSSILTDWSNALIDAEISNVNAYYEIFLRFQKEHSEGMRKPPLAWSDLAETYLQKSDFGVSGTLQKIYTYATADLEADNLFKNALKEIQYNVCNLKQSPHQVIFNLYNTVALAELKGNLVLQFAYMLLKVYGKGNFTLEAELAQERYEKNLEKEKKIVHGVLEDSDRSIYRCDPKQYVEGVNYERLTRLLQGYIENEVNLNPYGTCSENCNYYEYTDYNGCYKEQFCAHQPECQGKVLECRFVDSDMNICVSTNPDRRYDWIEYENGRVLGTKGICEYKNFFKVDSWWRYLFWHCSYCLCLCDDSRESDRYFSLKDVTSDIQKNKVVTGVKLVKNNHIIHLQIQQGVLGRKGKIEEETVTWKPVDNYTIDDINVESNVDYHMMTWLERSLDLDDVYGPPEHVVTGVRFRKLGTHLNLEIRLSRVNFTSGEVYGPEYSYWKGNDNTDASLDSPRSEIKLNNPDVPIRKGQHQLDSRHDQYVQFQATSYDTDAGQSTVPFIDSQPLTSGGFPLSGIGLIHRGKPGSGGFVAPKLISYNFAPHLQGKK